MNKTSEVSKIITDLVAYLLLKKPDDPVPYIIQFLEDVKHKGAAPLSATQKKQLEDLRAEYKVLEEKKRALEAKEGDGSGSDSDAGHKKKKGGSSSDSENDDEEYLDVVNDPYSPDQHQKKLQMAQKSRTSVSAEVFGKYHSKAAFQAKVIAKDAAVQKKIHERLAGAFMFMSLDEKDMGVVIDAMDQKNFTNGETVIQEGEPGDVLYIVETGSLSCHKIIDG